MPRRSSKIAVIYEAIPTPAPPPIECGGLMCMNMDCKRCWGILEDIERLLDPAPGVAVDLDDTTYAALSDAARRQGTTVSAVAQAVLRRWAAGQGARK